MAGRFALRAEVLFGFDQPLAEELRPDAVDGDPRGERVVAIDEPAGQRQPVGGGVLGQRAEERGDAGPDLVGRDEEIPLDHHVRFAVLCRRQLAHHGHAGHGAASSGSKSAICRLSAFFLAS